MAPLSQQQQERILEVLARCVSSITATGIYRGAVRHRAATRPTEAHAADARFVEACSQALALFCQDQQLRNGCVQDLYGIVGVKGRGMVAVPVEVPIITEQDIVAARLSARAFAQRLGFGSTDQAKISTAVSELARNISRYAKTGTIGISALNHPCSGIRITARDNGPGIPNLAEILAGEYRSKTGLGLGIVGCKRLMDEFSIEAEPGKGTFVTLAKYLTRTR